MDSPRGEPGGLGGSVLVKHCFRYVVSFIWSIDRFLSQLQVRDVVDKQQQGRQQRQQEEIADLRPGILVVAQFLHAWGLCHICGAARVVSFLSFALVLAHPPANRLTCDHGCAAHGCRWCFRTCCALTNCAWCYLISEHQ
jgi:hypothetical protein